MQVNLNNFTLDIIDHINAEKINLIRFTNYNMNDMSLFSSFNEKLTEKSNSQYSLSFSMESQVHGQQNPFIDLLPINREVRLTLDNDQIIDFVIVDITPTFSNNTILYNYNCQDLFSYAYSKQNIGFDLDTNDEKIWGSDIGPKTISQLAEKILELNHIKDWKIDPILISDNFQFFTNLYGSNTLIPLKVSVSLSNTNVFNAFVEIAKLFNAIVDINYNNKRINFINKENIKYKGFSLNEKVNLSKFSFSEKGSNLYNVMHVKGGEDAEGNLISLMPSMPLALIDIILGTDFGGKTYTLSNPIPIEGGGIEYKIDSINNFIVCKTTVENIEKSIILYKTSTGYYKLLENEEMRYKDWKSIEDLKELNNFFTYCYDTFQDLYNTISSKQELQDFLNTLEVIPSAGTFLYDFSYWRKNGLISEDRYTEMNKALSVDLRNINLLLGPYNYLYNKYSFLLNQKIKEEEELIALMAAEDKKQAEELKDNIIRNNNLYYQPFAKKVGKDEDEILYLELGSIDENGICHYGTFNTLVNYNLPEIKSLSKIVNTFYVKKVDNDTIEKINDVQIDVFGNIIITNPIWKEQILCVEYSKALSDSIREEPLIDIHGTDKNLISQYQTKLQNLWNEDYVYYYQTLYGANWLNRKKQEILKKQNDAKIKKQRLINQMISNFGADWRGVDHNVLSQNISKNIIYSDLMDQINKINIYIGDSYKDVSYKGVYDYYLLCIDELAPNTIFKEEFSLSYRLEELRELKEEWNNEFYTKYRDIIRETTYSDKNQLTHESLYGSAIKQFWVYNKPTSSYSASYIDLKMIDIDYPSITIGDLIQVFVKGVNYQKKNNEIVVTLKNSKGALNTHSILTINRERKTIDIPVTVYKMESNKYLFKGNFEYPKDKIIQIIMNDKSYKVGTSDIVSIENNMENQPIQLRVTGVTKTLRSNETQLTVEENTIYNTLVDRLMQYLK